MRRPLLVLAAVSLAWAGAARAATFVVRPGQSLARVQLAARRTPGADTIVLRGGTYRLARPLTLTAADSGVTWEAAPGETPVLSGGLRIGGWRALPDGEWAARLPRGFDTRQLWVDGVRATVARGPAPPLVPTATGYQTGDLSLAHWHDPSRIELVYDSVWRQYRGRIASIAGGTITMQQPFFANAHLDGAATIGLPAWIENAHELLDEPGEWYLDRAAATVYYLPLAGQEMTTADVVAPRLAGLVVGGGTLERPLHDVTFRGITFADATWLGPSAADGFVPHQADLYLTGRHATFAGADALVHKPPAAVRLRAAHRVQLLDDRFVRLGGSGIDLAYGSRDDTIQDCELSDIGANGIQLGDVTDFHPQDAREPVERIQVIDDSIHDVAVEYQGGVGIWGGYVGGVTVAHDELYDLPYTAISLGWGWGTRDAPPTPAGGNLVEANLIHDVVRVLGDGGGVYLLGAQPGTVVRGNVIERVGWGGALYLDDGSRGETVEDNVVVGSDGWPYMFKGTDSLVADNWWDFDSAFGWRWFAGTARDNHVISGLGDAPASIVGAAGQRRGR